MLLLLNYVSTPAATGVVGLGLGLTSQDDNTVAWTAQTTLDGAAVAADAAPGYTLLDTTGAIVASGQMTALMAVGWYYASVAGLSDRGHLLRVAALISDTEAVGVAAAQNTIELAAAATIASAVRTELTTELDEIGSILEDTGTTIPATLAGLATSAALAVVDTNVDTILEDTGTTIPATLAGLATSAALAVVDTNVDTILEDTGTTIPATLAGLATSAALAVVDNNVDAILEDTGTTIPATLAGLPTDQDVRDAMKLAPTAGDPAAGSVDKHLDDILTDTAGWASIVANSTDATASGVITRKRGNTWSIALTLGEVTGYTSLWFTIKRSYDDADSAALLHVKLNATGLSDGLLYANGAAATNDALASITVSNAVTGAIVIAVDETITDDIAPGSYYYDAQALISGDVTTPDSGTFTVTADVTRSVA